MASFWKEPTDEFAGPMHHVDTAEEADAIQEARDREWRYFVRVCGFTFQFDSLPEIGIALDWFARKTHPSSQIRKWPGGCVDRWDSEPWYDRLPQDLMSNQKRPRVAKALQRAIHEFSQ